MQKTKKSTQIVLVFLLTFVSLMKCEPEESRSVAALVSKINEPELQLTPNGQQQYDLVKELPNRSRRDEKVELRSEGTAEEYEKSVTNNEAGPNGNTDSVRIPQYLPPAALRLALFG